MSFCNLLGQILSISMCMQKFMSYGHFSLTVWEQNLHKLTREKQLLKLSHRTIIGHTPKVNLQLLCRSPFYGSCNNDQPMIHTKKKKKKKKRLPIFHLLHWSPCPFETPEKLYERQLCGIFTPDYGTFCQIRRQWVLIIGSFCCFKRYASVKST